MERFLTVAETAHALRVNADTVRRWLRAGKLRGVKFGQVYRIPESALLEGSPGRQPEAAGTTKLPTVSVQSGLPDPPFRGEYIESNETYRRRAVRALALIKQLAPIIQAGTLQPIDVAEEINAMRDERTEDILGGSLGKLDRDRH